MKFLKNYENIQNCSTKIAKARPGFDDRPMYPSVQLNSSSPWSGSSHIRSVLIGVKYRNWRRTLDVYLLFAILRVQIKSKLNYRLVTYKPASP